MYPTQTFQQPIQRWLGPMAQQPFTAACQPLQLMPQTNVIEGQTNQTNPPQVNVTEHESTESEQIDMTPATEDTDFYVGCHFTLIDNEEDDEPQPAAHQVYMMEQDDDNDMDDDVYW